MDQPFAILTAFMRWRGPASSARVVLYLMVMRRQPMALRARRSLIPNPTRRCATAARPHGGIKSQTPISKLGLKNNLLGLRT